MERFGVLYPLVFGPVSIHRARSKLSVHLQCRACCKEETIYLIARERSSNPSFFLGSLILAIAIAAVVLLQISFGRQVLVIEPWITQH